MTNGNPRTYHAFTTNNRTINKLLYNIITKRACPAEVTHEKTGIPTVDT